MPTHKISSYSTYFFEAYYKRFPMPFFYCWLFHTTADLLLINSILLLDILISPKFYHYRMYIIFCTYHISFVFWLLSFWLPALLLPPVKVMCLLFSGYFWDFILFFSPCSVTCLHVVFFVCIFFGVRIISWICSSISFINFLTFSATFLQIFLLVS